MKVIIATAASLRASEDGIHCFALGYWTGSSSFCARVCVFVRIFVPVNLISRKICRPVIFLQFFPFSLLASTASY